MRTGRMLLALALLATSRPADACETDTPNRGLNLDIANFEAMPMPPGGVIAVRGVAYGVDITAAMLELTQWEVLRDGNPQPGVFETHRMFDAAATPVTPEQHVFTLVWRPDAAFAPGSLYRLNWEVASDDFGPQTVEIAVDDGPPPSLRLPEVLPDPRRDVVDGSDEVCCQTGVDSCGTSFVCEPTRGTLLPTIGLELDSPLGPNPQQRMWVGRVLPDGATSPAVPPRDAASAYLGSWIGQIRFDAPADEYCVVVGVTSLVDGEEQRAPPLCVPRSVIGVPEQAEIEPSASLGPEDLEGGEGKCIGPLVYQEDGAAYPREADAPESGCRVDRRGAALWLLLPAGLALTRRRRARA